jgi:NADPH:quinone reductase-like Zn-dependent oxidoreductase
MRAVRFDRYGGLEVLEVRDVEDPVAGPGRVLVRMRAAAINPGEIAIREGTLAKLWPTTFPSGEGSDLAGVVEQVGDGVTGVSVGDPIAGWSNERSTHAELVAIPADQLAVKPDGASWEAAGSLYVAGMTAYASVDAVAPQEGETVVVSGAAGGVGTLTVQLARLSGANVIGLAREQHHEGLRAHDIVPVAYGEGQLERIREAAEGPVDAFMDTFGDGYADLAIELGVAPGRINTIIDRDAVERLGIQNKGGSSIASKEVMEELVGLVGDGQLEVPIAATYPLERVRDAYAELAKRQTRGKIVLVPG